MIPHFLNILEMDGSTFPDNDRFHILPVQSFFGPTRALHRILRESLELCPMVASRLVDWIRHHRTTNPSSPQSLSFRSPTSACSAVFVPPGRQCESAVAIRYQPVITAFSAAHPLLTRRENEIGHWLCAGKTNAEIAMILKIAPGTVKRHLENIYQKLGAPNRVSAATLIRDAMGSEGRP